MRSWRRKEGYGKRHLPPLPSEIRRDGGQDERDADVSRWTQIFVVSEY